MIIEHLGKCPAIHDSAYVAPNAVVSGEVIVGFQDGVDIPTQKEIKELNHGTPLAHDEVLDCALVGVGGDANVFISDIIEEPQVTYAEHNLLYQASNGA